MTCPRVPAPRRIQRRAGFIASLVLLIANPAYAGPFVDPGDLGLRHDVQLIADAGLLAAPLMTWPVSLSDLMRLDTSRLDEQPPHVLDAVRRIQRYTRRESRSEMRLHSRVALSNDPVELRHFGATAREKREAEVGAQWVGNRFAYRLNIIGAADPQDDKSLRFDGSYVGAALGNWMVSAGAQDRWWGPGWEGSLILGANARPVPGIALQRNTAHPFESRWLSWIGPWNLTAFAGQLEGGRHIPDAKLLGMRVNFKPTEKLEIGLSRTAQWGGQGRPQSFRSLVDLMLGNSNTGDTSVGGGEIDSDNTPGNQLAGYDVRWTSPIGDLPYALYGQLIGEDEAGGMPSQHMGLFGVETWGGWRSVSYRLHLEYADTAVRFASTEPNYNTAYEHSTYRTGYRYRGRSIGHAMDSDGRMYSLGLLVGEGPAHYWNVLLRRTEFNRDGSTPAHGLAPEEATLTSLDLMRGFTWAQNQLRAGAGIDRWQVPGDEPTTDGRVYAEIERRF